MLPPFQRLVDDCWADVARVAAAVAGPCDADDVAQQAWAQALAAYPRLRSTDNLRGWLLTITWRCAVDAHRARSRHPLPVEDLPDQPVADAASHAMVGDEPVWVAVRRLPQRQRRAVALRFVADLDHAAIAVAIGTTPGTSRQLVCDAVAALRRDLKTRTAAS